MRGIDSFVFALLFVAAVGLGPFTGASRLKVLSFALVPDVAPSMVSIGLFWWEFNVRASTVLGVVGAGGAVRSSRTSWTSWISRAS